jgi:hypothetical protein
MVLALITAAAEVWAAVWAEVWAAVAATIVVGTDGIAAYSTCESPRARAIRRFQYLEIKYMSVLYIFPSLSRSQ